MNSMLLIAVDARSKWPEVAITSSKTSKTIEALRAMFSTHGLPSQIVSDNGPQFLSTEFKPFLQMNGIQHLTSAQYHPRTNGLAERFVRTMKESFKNDRSTASLQYKLDTFLLKYRNCPHATTGNSPAVMLMGRPLRCHLGLLKPEIAKGVMKEAKSHHGHARHLRQFSVGDKVLARSHGRGDPWAVRIVTKQTGPLSYQIQCGSSVWHRHVDQLKRCDLPLTDVHPKTSTPSLETSLIPLDNSSASQSIPSIEPSPSEQLKEASLLQVNKEVDSKVNKEPTTVGFAKDPVSSTTLQTENFTERSRPVRNQKPSGRLKDFMLN